MVVFYNEKKKVLVLSKCSSKHIVLARVPFLPLTLTGPESEPKNVLRVCKEIRKKKKVGHSLSVRNKGAVPGRHGSL